MNTREKALILTQDAVARAKLEHRKDWLDMKDEHGFDGSGETLRKHGAAFKWLEDNQIVDFSQIKLSDYDTPNYKESVELIKDGTQKSDKLIELSETDMKDEDAVLNAHGYNPDIWEIVNAKNSIFNVNAKGGITKTLYSSKITVKKKENSFNIDKLIEKLKIKPSNLSYKEEQGENMLVIPYFDKHFGIATFKHYIPVLSKTITRIKSKTWDKIVIVCGQDELHNDGFTGQTTSGTMIDKVDMEQAWVDAFNFESAIIDEAIKNSNSVEVVFSAGNHDQAMGWALTKTLEVKYPQLKFDTEMKQFKALTWKNIFLAITHGDKANQQRAVKAILAEYGKLMTSSNTREILTGHLHHTKTHDDFGIVYRTLGSGVPTDGYHADHGFIGAMKQFQMLEYNQDFIEAIYYV